MAQTKEAGVDRLLLVDDNPTNLQVLYQALEAEGYELLVAQSGAEAIATAKEAKPHLILLDINMPGIDGYETCRRLKREPETKNIPVVLLTAKGRDADKRLGYEVGAVDYVIKPFSPNRLIERIQEILGCRS